MCVSNNAKSLVCELSAKSFVNADIFILQFIWTGQPPKAGQFFMLRPERSGVFLPRPISIFEFNYEQNILKFIIARCGKGTDELSCLNTGEKVRLTGPLGNAWADFLPESVSCGAGKAALVGGGLGIAPLAALIAENKNYHFHFYAGFKNGFKEKEEEDSVLGAALNAKKMVITAEDGKNALYGRILDYIFEPENYDVIFGCGSIVMLQALKKKCESRGVTCFLSMESRMACGTGACFGCTIRTLKGNRRCCAEGPIFPAGDILFDE